MTVRLFPTLVTIMRPNLAQFFVAFLGIWFGACSRPQPGTPVHEQQGAQVVVTSHRTPVEPAPRHADPQDLRALNQLVYQFVESHEKKSTGLRWEAQYNPAVATLSPAAVVELLKEKRQTVRVGDEVSEDQLLAALLLARRRPTEAAIPE
jgi:hypothetical protein